LLREAEVTRPAFSETLHVQIWRAVQESKATVAAAEPYGASARWRLRWSRAVAIAASLLVGALIWQAVEEKTIPGSAVTVVKAPEPAESSPDTELDRVAELTGGATEKVDTWLDSTLASQRWAYLDHDAQAALDALASCLPFSLALDESPEESTGPASSARSVD
jgi:hypothetical protein